MDGQRGTAQYRGADRRSPLGGSAAAYRGPDRRTTPGARLEISRIRHLTWPLVVFAFVFAVLRADAVGTIGGDVAYGALRDTSAGLLLLCGTVFIVVWALTGRAARAIDGAALLLVGGGLLALAGPYGELLHRDPTLSFLSPACCVAIGLPAAVLLVYAPSAVPVDSTIRPLRVLALAAAVTLGLLGCLGVARIGGPLDNQTVWAVAVLALAAGWVGGAVRHMASPRGGVLDDRQFWLGTALLAYGLGEAGVAAAVEHHTRLALFGVELQVLGAAGALWLATAWLLEALRRDGNRLMRLAGELQSRSEVLAVEQALRERLLHDGRNMLAAVQTANITLNRYRERLDQSTQESLRLAAGSELERLGRLLDPSNVRDLVTFDLRVAVVPLVEATQLAGVQVQLQMLEELMVVGRPTDTSAVVQALLTNAAQHAPGAEVVVWAERDQHDIRLVIADRGRGVADGEREAVFRRGFGAAERDGRSGGLGLYISRRLMADQDGLLALERHDGWGVYAVLTLPVAVPFEVTDKGAEGLRAATSARPTRAKTRPTLLPEGRPGGARFT